MSAKLTKLAVLGIIALVTTACGGGAGEGNPTSDIPTTNVTVPEVVKDQEVVSAPPESAIDISQFGAICNGRFDNRAAISSAIDAAKSRGLPVYVPVGTCAYSDVINLDGVRLFGAGDTSQLYALNPSRASIYLKGDRGEVRKVRLSGVKASSRQAAWEASRITVIAATNFTIESVTIDGAAANGIHITRSSQKGAINRNVIRDTLADSIHMTDKVSYISLTGNRIENSGDDGIAVVSYRGQGAMVNNIVARNNVITNNKWGRQMTVVGGEKVLYENNLLSNNLASFACLYFAQEEHYKTYGAHDVIARYNTVSSCGGRSTGQGAIMIHSNGAEANTNIMVERNDVQQAGQPGIVVRTMSEGVTIRHNRIRGASPDLETSKINDPREVAVTPYTTGAVGYVER